MGNSDAMFTGMSRIELVDTGPRLSEVVDRISGAHRVAVDIESNGFFRYHERVCLIQLAAYETAFLIDPLAIDDVQPLGDLLGDQSVEKVFHGADYDLRSLDRDWGFRVNNLFDTGIAAALVGSARLGLQSVVQEQLGIELPKPLELQRSDWTLRPLSPEALDYAANDVLHLSRVRETLASQLKALSRLEWAKEEFTRLENVRHAPADRESAFLSVKGSQGLDGRGLAILHSLFQFREREASRLDRSRFRVMPDSALVQVASEPTADLPAVKGLGRYGRSPACEGLRDAIDRGLAAPRVTRPKPIQNEDPLEPAEREKVMLNLRALKTWRRRLGHELGMDPSLLWSAVSLERLARRPSDLDSEFLSSEVRSWQRREFGAALRRTLAVLNNPDRMTYQGRPGPE